MNVNYIKVGGPLGHCFEQSCLGGHRIRTGPPEPKSVRPDRLRIRARDQVAAGKERHLMTEVDKLLCQPCDYSFRSPV